MGYRGGDSRMISYIYIYIYIFRRIYMLHVCSASQSPLDSSQSRLVEPGGETVRGVLSFSIFGGAGHGSMAGRIQGCSNACFACVYTVKRRAPSMHSALSLDLCPDKDSKPSIRIILALVMSGFIRV